MRTFGVSRPRASMVVAFVALVAALSGSAAALPGKNTVDSRDIKNGQVKRADINNGAVSSAKVKDGSLRAQDFRPGQLPKGDKGDRGDRGVAGAPGSALAFARVRANATVDVSNSKNIVASTPQDGRYCLIVPPGSRSIVAQLELDGAFPGDQVVTSLVPATVDAFCGSGPDNAVVFVVDSAVNGVNRNFMVLVN
ncbi:MAG: hypothetical protein ACRDLS_15915 [Solirubrobacteraceae bacterium]